MQAPFISIIIPSYNSASYIKRLMGSLLSQTFTNWEAIIVDNNSKDDTIELLNDYNDSRIKIYTIHNEGVIAKSRNFAITQSNGTWLAFLDADDWWTPNKLSECVQQINTGNFDLIYHDLFLVTKPNQDRFKKLARSRKLNSPVFNDLLFNGNGILNSSVLVKKELLTNIGMLSCDPEKITWEDYDCWLRISKMTERFLYIKKSLGYYWAAGGNMTNPDRDLINAKSIYNIYIRSVFSKIPAWILFSEAKALIKIGRKKEGIAKLNTIKWMQYSFIDFIKARVLIILSIMNNKK